MKAHVTALGTLHVILSIVYFAFGLMGLFLFGGWTGLTGVEFFPQHTIQLLGPFGGTIWLLVTIYSIPQLISAIGLLLHKKWGMWSMFAVSALGIPIIPIGPVLGFYGFGVLIHPETKKLFSRRVG